MVQVLKSDFSTAIYVPNRSKAGRRLFRRVFPSVFINGNCRCSTFERGCPMFERQPYSRMGAGGCRGMDWVRLESATTGDVSWRADAGVWVGCGWKPHLLEGIISRARMPEARNRYGWKRIFRQTLCRLTRDRFQPHPAYSRSWISESISSSVSAFSALSNSEPSRETSRITVIRSLIVSGTALNRD